MKISASAIAVAALAFSASASASAQTTVRDYCGSLSTYAYEVAKARDGGIPEWKARTTAGDDDSPATLHLNRIVTYVYIRPHQIPSEEASQVFDECVRALAQGA